MPKKYQLTQRGFAPLLLIAVVAILVFLIASSTFSFKDKIFNKLFPKPSSHAANITNFPGNLANTTFIFYYDWYSAPPRTPSYGHWDGGGSHTPPADIASSFYPQLGPYDSFNPQVINQHMAWIKQSGVDVVVLDYWGQSDYTTPNIKAVMDAANAYGLKVSFLIEPYNGRTNASIVSDVKYIIDNYGNHPAFYRVSRSTKEDNYNTNPRPIFFLYAPDLDSTMPTAFDSIRGTSYDSVLLARLADNWLYDDSVVSQVVAGTHLDGLFNYSVTQPDTQPFPRSNDYILIYATQTGFDNTRSVTNPAPVINRQNGAFYDNLWSEMVREKPEAVSIISFNEYHEGTQIEPSVPHTYNGYTYSDFEGAYGQTGQAATMAYINRTAYWINQYKGTAGVANASPTPTASPSKPTPTPTATPTPTPTASPTATPTATPAVQMASAAVASPTTASRGSTVNVTGYFGSSVTIPVLIDIEIYNSSNVRVFKYYWDNQTLTAYTAAAYPTTWTIPTNLARGTYTVKTAIFSQHATALFQYNLNAATIIVY